MPKQATAVFLTSYDATTVSPCGYLVGRRLTAQSSVVNGTAEAENIDVDEVFRAGGLADGADNGRRHTRG